MNELKDYILVLDDIIPDKLCDDILNEYIHSNEWMESHAVNDTDRKIRNCYAISLSSQQTIDKNKIIRKLLDDKIFEIAKLALTKYNKKFNNTQISKDSGYDLLKYDKGGFYIEHIDSFIEIPRTISCSFILNDNFKGGEFCFFENKFIHSLKKGSAILFPSNFMYPHSILPVTDGTRYSIVTWFI